MQDFILFPAYGENPPTGASAQKSFLSGKDWTVGRFGPYCSIRDFSEGRVYITLCFGKNLHSTRYLTLDNGELVD